MGRDSRGWNRWILRTHRAPRGARPANGCFSSRRSRVGVLIALSFDAVLQVERRAHARQRGAREDRARDRRQPARARAAFRVVRRAHREDRQRAEVGRRARRGCRADGSRGRPHFGLSIVERRRLANRRTNGRARADGVSRGAAVRRDLHAAVAFYRHVGARVRGGEPRRRHHERHGGPVRYAAGYRGTCCAPACSSSGIFGAGPGSSACSSRTDIRRSNGDHRGIPRRRCAEPRYARRRRSATVARICRTE